MWKRCQLKYMSQKNMSQRGGTIYISSLGAHPHSIRTAHKIKHLQRTVYYQSKVVVLDRCWRGVEMGTGYQWEVKTKRQSDQVLFPMGRPEVLQIMTTYDSHSWSVTLASVTATPLLFSAYFYFIFWNNLFLFYIRIPVPFPPLHPLPHLPLTPPPKHSSEGWGLPWGVSP